MAYMKGLLSLCSYLLIIRLAVIRGYCTHLDFLPRLKQWSRGLSAEKWPLVCKIEEWKVRWEAVEVQVGGVLAGREAGLVPVVLL